MKSSSLTGAIKAAAFGGLIGAAVVAAWLTPAISLTHPGSQGGSGSSTTGYSANPPSVQFSFQPSLSGDESGLVDSGFGGNSASSSEVPSHSQQPSGSDWDNQVYNPKKPETIDILLSSSQVCSSSPLMLEARVTNGWALYDMGFVITDSSQRTKYKAGNDSNFAGRSTYFTLKPGEIHPGKYVFTASAKRKELRQTELPMSVTKPFEVIVCKNGSALEVLRSENYGIRALDGLAVITALDGWNGLRYANVYLTTAKGTVEIPGLFTDELVVKVENGVPYSVQAIVEYGGVKEFLSATYKVLR